MDYYTEIMLASEGLNIYINENVFIYNDIFLLLKLKDIVWFWKMAFEQS